jgi:DNA-binding NtrC family response regulator/predicted hydrocarbon binding protein
MRPTTHKKLPKNIQGARLPSFDDLVSRLHLAPETGQIWLDGKRMFMLHLSAFGALRRELIESLGIDQARGLLTRMGHQSGSRDAELVNTLRKGSNVYDAFSIGPQLHAVEGVVRVEPITLDIDVARGRFYAEVLWWDSIEDEAHMADYGIAADPVCWMQIGYASGFSSAFFGRRVIYREVECAAMGHEACRIVGKPVDEWDDAQEDLRFFDAQPFANRKLISLGSEKSAFTGDADNKPISGKAPKSRYKRRELIGSSAPFNSICHMIDRVASTTTPVLLLGETGVGKEIFAQTLHSVSPRADKPFIAVNCAAIPEQLIEADLFGVEKGAFTGATACRPGRFELADGGSLFLDEIGCLSLAAQSKLLRVLQEGEVERVGSTKSRHLDVRIIAATNTDLETAVAKGNFRQDLLFRLNVFPISIPPLRERREDIPILAGYFVRRYCEIHNRQRTGFTERALEALLSYDWPGNVREIENVVERAIILSSEGGSMDIGHLPAAVATRVIRNPSPTEIPESRPRSRARTLVVPISSSQHIFTPATTPVSLDTPLGASLQQVIEKHRGNLSAAARELGISRAQIAYRAQRLGLATLFRRRT